MVPDTFELESIWNDLDSMIPQDIETKENDCCNHCIKIFNPRENSNVCESCGEVFPAAFETQEWNSYKNDSGQFQKNGQRGDTYISDNPYDKGGSIPGFNKNSFAMRLHYQQAFSHKQKTFWKISEKFQSYIIELGVSTIIFSDAKNMWHICMESGKLTRASIRNGLIAACLYYSGIYNNTPIDRQKLIDITEGTQKGFLKGEKIFLELMENSIYKNLGKKRIDIKDNDSFVKYCNSLDLPFSMAMECNDIFEKCKDFLDSVTPKSSVAGIIFYVVKNVHGLNKPSKTRISNETTVCIPTINKVICILKDNIN